jgi:hypothetical protein
MDSPIRCSSLMLECEEQLKIFYTWIIVDPCQDVRNNLQDKARKCNDDNLLQDVSFSN